jgi:hypothetical protein
VSDQTAAPAVTSTQATEHVRPPAVVPPRTVDPAEEAARTKAITQLLNAVMAAADAAAMAPGAEDKKDFATAALQMSQAAVILDPNLVAPSGVPADALHPPVPRIQMDKTAPSAAHPAG